MESLNFEEYKIEYCEYFEKSENKLETFIYSFLKLRMDDILDKKYGKYLFDKIYSIYQDDIYSDEIYQQSKTIISNRNKNVTIQMVFSAYSFYLGLYVYCGENLKFILAILRNEDINTSDFIKLSRYFIGIDKESDNFIEFYNIYKSKYYKQFYDLMWNIFKSDDPISEAMRIYEKMIEYKLKNSELEDRIKELEISILHYQNMPYSENYYKAEEHFKSNQ